MPPATVETGATERNLECRIADRIPILPTLLLIVFGLLVPLPAGWLKHPVAEALAGLTHVLIFALVTLFLYRRGPLSGRLTYSVCAVLLLGLAIEVVQPLVGRSASLDDFVFDAVGALLAVAWVWRCRSGRRRPLILVAVALVAIVFMLRTLPVQLMAMSAVARSFPVLEDFGDEHTMTLWRTNYGSRIERQLPTDPALDAPQNKDSAHLLLTGGPPDRWPGAIFNHFPRDWSDYEVLAFRARRVAAADTSAQRIRFCVRLDDVTGDQGAVWFVQCFEASNDWQDFQIDLRSLLSSSGDRGLKLQEMLSMVIFLSKPTTEISLAVDDLRLR